MKKLIPASILCLMFVFSLRAQQPPPDVPKLTNPFVTPPVNIGVWSVVKGSEDSQKHELLVRRAQELLLAGTFKAKDTGVCSVPLLEANVPPANDPGIATKISDNSIPMRQAHVPAPSCKK
jgi:hypothetical protein